MKLKCVVIDDDPACCDLVASMVEHHPKLELHGKFNDPREAKHFLQSTHIELVFADMEMPGMRGIELIQSLKEPPQVIFITSHRDYAVESFEIRAVDYIIKPIRQSRFNIAVEHALKNIINRKISSQKPVIEITGDKTDDHFFIRSDSTFVRINFDDVVYIEALRDFVKIHTPDKVHIALINLKNIEGTLPDDVFLRTHRSFIVNRHHINSINTHDIETDLGIVPLGNSYKDDVFNEILGNRLVKR